MDELIQVAGVIDQDEADMLVACGVPLLGFPLRLPVNAEDLPETDAGGIIRRLRPPHYGVLVTYLNRAEDIMVFCQELGARIVQLHGPISLEELTRLRAADAELQVIKSLVVGRFGREELREMVTQYAPLVDAFITDTHNPQTGAEGATGQTHDWSISRELVELSPRPVILAGGLTPENVAEAIRTVRPAGVDAHTGLEGADGRKDEAKVRRFLAEARKEPGAGIDYTCD